MDMPMAQATAPKWLVFNGPSLLSWRRVESNWPQDEMLWKKATEDQVCFVGDTLPKAYSVNIDERLFASEYGIQVIGGHTSKSCDLPVYGVDIPSIGVRAVLSNNFYGWAVSLEIPRVVDLSMFDDRVSKEAIDPLYCSGFEGRWVKGPRSVDPCAFTTQVWSQHDLYAMFLSISHQVRTGR